MARAKDFYHVRPHQSLTCNRRCQKPYYKVVHTKGARQLYLVVKYN